MKSGLVYENPCDSCKNVQAGLLSTEGHQYLYLSTPVAAEFSMYSCLLCLAKLHFDEPHKKWTLHWDLRASKDTCS
jgi:hypothetical protein